MYTCMCVQEWSCQGKKEKTVHITYLVLFMEYIWNRYVYVCVSHIKGLLGKTASLSWVDIYVLHRMLNWKEK